MFTFPLSNKSRVDCKTVASQMDVFSNEDYNIFFSINNGNLGAIARMSNST